MNIAEHVERGSRDYPDRIALLFEGRAITYRVLDEMSSRAAGIFTSMGIGAGDRTALFLPNIPAFVSCYLGALKLGAIAVSVNATLKRDEIAFILADSGAKAVVTTLELREHIPSHAADFIHVVGDESGEDIPVVNDVFTAKSMDPDAPAAIVYTSGTTGQPKGATLSHKNVVRNCDAKAHYLGIRVEDRALLFMPLYHCFGQNAILNAFLQAGATVVLHRRFDLGQVMQSIARDGVTMFFGVPTTYLLLLDKVQPVDMGAVRYCFSAAAPLPFEVEKKWEEKFGMPIFQGYGLTETSPFAAYNHLQRYRPGSIGTPIDGVEMKIVDPNTGMDAAPGEKGEIAVRGHNVMLGYWNRPEDTAKRIRDGWFFTGDIGSVDHDGYFFIHDRLTDMIVSGGVNVYPAEIENVLSTHTAILESAVYGVAEPLLGEQVCADIVLKPEVSVSEAEIRAFCREKLSAVKVPAKIQFCEEIPKSPTGKILKRVLREKAIASAWTPEGMLRDVGQVEAIQWIQAWLRKNVNMPSGKGFDPRMTFADMGLDSILSVRMANELGEWLGHKVEVSAAWSFPTVAALAGHVVSRNQLPRRDSDDPEIFSEDDIESLLVAELEKINR